MAVLANGEVLSGEQCKVSADSSGSINETLEAKAKIELEFGGEKSVV